MYDFILQLFLVGSLAVMVYLMARSLPRVEGAGERSAFLDYLGKWARKIPVTKIDSSLSNYLEKTLRKIKIFVLKIDNVINKRLNKKNSRSDGDSHDFIDQMKS